MTQPHEPQQHARLPVGLMWHRRCNGCGKLTFESRKDARKAAKIYHPGDSTLRAYRCRQGGSGWHNGHLADWQLRGEQNPRTAKRQREKERQLQRQLDAMTPEERDAWEQAQIEEELSGAERHDEAGAQDREG